MDFSSTLANVAKNIAGKLGGSKAVIVNLATQDLVTDVQFNPSEYRVTDAVSFNEESRREKDRPVVSFGGRNTSTLNVKLYFDCDEPMSISSLAGSVMSLMSDNSDKSNAQLMSSPILEKIDKIVELTKIDGDEHMPPAVAFVWGALQFMGYITSATTTYTMFDKAGRPLRATVDLVMKGNNGALDERKSPMSSPDRTKARIMTEDTNIWNIAEKEYGDVREWRRIADANGIMNPLDIPVGQVLKVPAIIDR